MNAYMYLYVYVCTCMYRCDCVGQYVSVFVCIPEREYLYISNILYTCDILVLYKLSIIINPASWLPHANKEYIIINIRKFTVRLTSKRHFWHAFRS